MLFERFIPPPSVSDDIDIDEYVSLDEAAIINLGITMDDISLNEEASLNEDITFDVNIHIDGGVSLGDDTGISMIIDRVLSLLPILTILFVG